MRERQRIRKNGVNFLCQCFEKNEMFKSASKKCVFNILIGLVSWIQHFSWTCFGFCFCEYECVSRTRYLNAWFSLFCCIQIVLYHEYHNYIYIFHSLCFLILLYSTQTIFPIRNKTEMVQFFFYFRIKLGN